MTAIINLFRLQEMYRLSLFLVSACALAAASRINSVDKPYYPLEEAEIHFEAFIEKFNRSYSSEEEKKMCFESFKKNLEIINKHNMDSLTTAIFGITQFSDLTEEEFIQRYTGLDLSLRVPGDTGNMVNVSGPVTIEDIPDSFSWVDKGVVTRVKDQKVFQCGSCWAFAAVGSIEGAYARKYGHLMEFSEKQLVDCDPISYGCKGGLAELAIMYLIKAGGIEGEADYPYLPREDTCQFDANKIKTKIVDMVKYKLHSEEALRQTLYTDGPLSIAMDGTTLLNYHGGILTLKDCPGKRLTHEVLLVGYGSENGVPYWIIKNSFGPTFGEKGYIRIKRNENTCGIMKEIAVRPVVG